MLLEPFSLSLAFVKIAVLAAAVAGLSHTHTHLKNICVCVEKKRGVIPPQALSLGAYDKIVAISDVWILTTGKKKRGEKRRDRKKKKKTPTRVFPPFKPSLPLEFSFASIVHLLSCRLS